MNWLSLSLMIDIGCVFHFDKENCWMDCPYDSRTVGRPCRTPLQLVDGIFRLPLLKRPAYPQALPFPDSRVPFLNTFDYDTVIVEVDLLSVR